MTNLEISERLNSALLRSKRVDELRGPADAYRCLRPMIEELQREVGPVKPTRILKAVGGTS